MELSETEILMFSEKRRMLVESLRRNGITDENVLNAINKIPREIFVNQSFINRAYEDTALPIDCNQTISQPYTVAYQTQLLDVKKDDKILEIGTGSGYQSSILFEIGARVFTIERIPELFENAKEIFKKNNINVNVRLGDGTLGWKEYAPYNGIIVTAAAPEVPKSLIDQLAIGGKLVIPVGDKESQAMILIEKTEDGNYRESVTNRFKFVPLIGKEGWTA